MSLTQRPDASMSRLRHLLSKRNIGLAINSLINANFMFHLKYTASKISIMLTHCKYVYVWINFQNANAADAADDLDRFSVQIWVSLTLLNRSLT